MGRRIVCLGLCFLFVLFASGQQNYGLAFNSFNAPQESRTSLQIGEGNPVCFSGNLDFSFDFYFIPNRTIYFGYLFRMINNSGQNIDLLYNQKNLVFNTVVGETFSDINFNFDNARFYKGWTNIHYRLTGNTLSLYLDGKPYKTVAITLKDKCFKILFGANDLHAFSTTDVPPMVIRNVSIQEDGKQKFYWPLNNSSEQQIVKDSIDGQPAAVRNPVWQGVLHQQWQLLKSLTVPGIASVAYNMDGEELYVVAADSVYRQPVSDIMPVASTVPFKDYHLYQGNQSIYNANDHNLYNFYIDTHAISGFSFQNGTWDKKMDSVLNTEYGHTNRVYVKAENALYIFGGYGQMKYKNRVQRYDFNTKQWADVAISGDYFTPRYMAAAGQSGNNVYILGGYGNHSGDQLLNPGYLYDFLKFDLKTHAFKKIYTLPVPDSSFVFAGSMYVDTAGKCFYALCFDRSKYDTKLHLVKGSLEKPQYEFLGDDIPYAFHDVVSDADLFYSPASSQLIAVTQLADLGKKTTVQVYGIAFQPEAVTKELPVSPLSKKYLLIGALLLVLLAAVGFFILKRRKPKQALQSTRPVEPVAPVAEAAPQSVHQPALTPDTTVHPSPEPPVFVKGREATVQVHLFGSFEITGKENNKISQELSPLLKELFLVILLNRLKYGKGVSTENLNEIFWGNKPDKHAKNNLSVNIVRLKGILSKVEGIHIVKNGEYWECEYNDQQVSIDLADFLQLRKHYPDEHGTAYLDKMLYFVSRGALLKQQEYNWLDNIKADINNKIIDELSSEITYLDPKKDAEYIIEAANCIFNFDFLNEAALRYKCRTLDKLGRHSIAKSTYERFAKEYLKSYGEEFPISFTEILK